MIDKLENEVLLTTVQEDEVGITTLWEILKAAHLDGQMGRPLSMRPSEVWRKLMEIVGVTI